VLRLPRLAVENMFNQNETHTFVEVNRRMEYDGDVCFRRYTFHFKSRKNHTYLAYLDEFEDYHLCIIKFFLKAHSLSEKKFQLLTGNNEAAGLITTCLAIMWQFYKENPYRPFGFIGMNSEGENTDSTKRFKLYSKVMARKFSPQEFRHLIYPKKSAYLMLNVHAAETNPALLDNIETFFDKHYEDLF
jgi:hypothetical protein